MKILSVGTFLAWTMTAFALGSTHVSVPDELASYLRSSGQPFRYTVERVSPKVASIELVSQVWQGIAWKNQILFSTPDVPPKKGVAILFITGDGPRPGDYKDIALFTAATHMPVAMLFNIPNQPLWGMKEDDLIAYTFEQYLSTGDPTWPLLFPMVKSAECAMDAVVAATKGTDNPIHSFVVTGASKRGWTTWLVEATGDRRVIGVAPMVYDNLKIVPQMHHQISSWGAYSEQIQDYTRRGLQAKLETPEGQKLSDMVDPYSYRSQFRAPILVVKGSNDPYWAADATEQYWDELRPKHWMLTVPNAGHTLNGGLMAAITVGAFARAMSGEFRLPRIAPRVSERVVAGQRELTYEIGRTSHVNRLRVWVAFSDSLDFRKETYKVLTPDKASKSAITVHFPADRNAAAFLEAICTTPEGSEFSLGAPTHVFKKATGETNPGGTRSLP